MSNMVFMSEPLPPKDEDEQISADASSEMASWYYTSDGRRLGPVSAEVIGDLVRRRAILPETFVWNPDFGTEWRTVRDIAFGTNSSEGEANPVILTATARYVLSRLRFEKHDVDYRPGSVLIRIDDEEHVFDDSDAIEHFGREKGYLPSPKSK
jgi:hypothetical protein